MWKSKNYDLDFKRFINEGDYIEKKNNDIKKAIKGATVLYFTISAPQLASATTEAVMVVNGEGASCGHSGSFWKLENKVLLLFDTGIVIALMISGGAWMFGGERGKVIERIIMACSGYILARHASDIMCWLKQF